MKEIVINVKDLELKELQNLKEKIDKEIKEREQEQYFNYLNDFNDALKLLRDNFPEKTAFTLNSQRWNWRYLYGVFARG